MATFKILQYKQKVLKDGTHPIVLQVVHKSKPFKISLGFSCTLNQWDYDKGRFKKSLTGHTRKNRLLRDTESKADEILDKIQQLKKPFTPELFRQLFTGTNSNISVFDFFNQRIADLAKKGKAGNKNIYTDTRNAVKRFWKSKKTLMFPDIDYKFLTKFETFLFETGCSGGGVSFYMRTLRATINEAIRQGYLDKDLYPFATSQNKNGYSLSHLKSKASPRALSIADMEKFKSFPSKEYPHLEDSYQLFLFSYFARGMNFKDMALLKWTDLYNDRISYTREKTGRFMSIRISENIQSILDYFKDQQEVDYVFPILSDFHQTEEQVKNRVKKCLKKLNKDLKEIASLCGIEVVITSYVARHTWATTLKYKNADIGLISEGLGHNHIETTKHYLKKFEDAQLDGLDELL